MMYYVYSTVIIYIVITAAVRILGKRQIGELQPTELVVTFLISDLAVLPLQNGDESLWSGLICVGVLVAVERAAAYLLVKSGLFRRLVCGKPMVIIREGKIIQSALRKLRITAEELFEELRRKDVFSLDDIYCAIIETDGSLSILLRSSAQTVTRKDMKLKGSDSIMVTVVTDGALSRNSMRLIGVSEEDVKAAIKRENHELKDIFIMLMDSNKNTRIIQKTQQ